MKIYRYCLALIFLLPVLQLEAGAQNLKRYEFEQQQMGTVFKLTFYAADDSVAEAASKRAYQHVEDLNSILSDYEPESNLNQLSARSGTIDFIPVDPVLFKVISKAQEVARQTGGAFDITTGPYVKLWRKIRRTNDPQLPSPELLRKYQQRVGYWHLKVDSSTTSVALIRPDMQLDLGGIAKGYAADEMLRVLNEYGIQAALVDAGGDIRMGDPPPGKEGWTIRIPGHQEDGKRHWITLQLANRAVATSGDLFQHLEIGRHRYSHIINPRTGLGLTDQSMVTVVAPDGITADSYASAVSVLGADAGVSFIESKPGCAVRIEYKKAGDMIEIKKSSGFDQLRVSP